MRRLTGWLVLVLLALAGSHARAAERVVVDDFESGIASWFTTDSTVLLDDTAQLCSIYPVAKPAPRGGGKQSALVEFLPAENCWAVLERGVSGGAWADADCGQLSFWVKGDGSKQDLLIVLRAYPPGLPEGVDFGQKVTIQGSDWQRFALRFFGFTTSDGKSLTPDRLYQVTQLRLKKTGSWPAWRFYLDEIVAEEIGTLPPPPEVSPETAVEVDFGALTSSVLAQLGARFGPPAAAIVDKGGVPAARLAKYLKQISPCVIGVRLNDYFNATKGTYDVNRLLAHLDWLERANMRWLLTLNPPPGAWDNHQLYETFLEAASAVATLKASSDASHYYELFEEPLAGQRFAQLEDALAAYNVLAAAIKRADPGAHAHIGGMGFASAGNEALKGLLGSAVTLDFLSYHFFSGHTGALTDTQAVESAFAGQSADLSNQLSLGGVRALVRGARPKLGEVFVTDLWLNSATDFSQGSMPRQFFAAAWLGTAAIIAAPTQDKLFLRDLCAPKTGLFDAQAQLTPLYHATWMLSNWMPRQAVMTPYVRPSAEVLACGVRTSSAYNVVIAYAGAGPVKLRIKPKGLTGSFSVRLRKLDPGFGDVQMTDLPSSLTPLVEMQGPGLAVLQFIRKPATP